MLKSGKYSDLTIKCGESVFKVHRNVICLQSKPLAAAVDGDFKVRYLRKVPTIGQFNDKVQESVTKVIELEEEEPPIVERMVQFMYNRDYSDADGSDATKDRLLINTKVYIIADKFDIPGLKLAAKEKYQEAKLIEWNCPSFFESLKLMYENTLATDRLLKEVAIEVVAKHVKELVDREEFGSLCKESGEIAFDVLKASLNLSSAEIPSKLKKSGKKNGEAKRDNWNAELLGFMNVVDNA